MPVVQNRTFWVADLNARGEVQLKAQYRYEQLERIAEASELIVHLATLVWRSPEEFETVLPGTRQMLGLRWRASSPGSGVVTIRCEGVLASLSLAVSGMDPMADGLTLRAFQSHQLAELRDTGFEPSFELLHIPERPLLATVNFSPPRLHCDQFVAALADRCFAAAYFRTQHLA